MNRPLHLLEGAFLARPGTSPAFRCPVSREAAKLKEAANERLARSAFLFLRLYSSSRLRVKQGSRAARMSALRPAPSAGRRRPAPAGAVCVDRDGSGTA